MLGPEELQHLQVATHQPGTGDVRHAGHRKRERIFLPILRIVLEEDAPFALEPREIARAGQRRQNRRVEAVELRLFGELEDVGHDRVHVLRIDPEDERSDDADAVALDARNVLAVVVEAAALRHPVLAYQRQRLGVGALQADEHAGAPCRPRQLRQLLVVSEIDRHLRDPALVEPCVGHRAKQIEAALLRLAGEAVQVVVHEDDVAFLDAAHLVDDVGDVAHPEQAAVERGDGTERAVHGTAARGLRRHVLVPVLLENGAVRPKQRLAAGAPLIHASELAVLEVRDHLRPLQLAFPHEQRIGVLRGLVGNERRVDPAHDDGNAAIAELGGDSIRARRLGGEGGEAYQVGLDVAVIESALALLVDELDLPMRRSRGRDVGQCERLPQVVAVQRDAVARIDEDELHAAASMIASSRPTCSKIASARSMCSGA